MMRFKLIIVFLAISQISVCDNLHYNTLSVKDTTQLKSKHAYKSVFGTSLTYIWQESNTQPSFVNFREYTLKNTFSGQIDQFRVGFSYYQLWTNGLVGGFNKYNLKGLFVQYHIPLKDNRTSFYLESNLLFGDYCTCQISAVNEPFRDDGLNYLGYGIGIESKVYRNFYFDIGFINHRILNKLQGKYNYTQYIAALKYQIDWSKILNKPVVY